MKNIQYNKWSEMGMVLLKQRRGCFLKYQPKENCSQAPIGVCKKNEGEDLSADVIYKLNSFRDASLKKYLNLKIRINLEIHMWTSSKTHAQIHFRIKF